MTLREMTEQYRALLSALDANDEDGSQELELALNAVTDDIETKALNIAQVIREIGSEAAVIRDEELRLQKRRQSRENAVKRLKEYLMENMTSTGIKLVTGPLYTVSLQNNPPSVTVVDEKSIPDAYWISQAPRLDKSGILQELKTGNAVPGAELTQSVGVRIR